MFVYKKVKTIESFQTCLCSSSYIYLCFWDHELGTKDEIGPLRLVNDEQAAEVSHKISLHNNPNEGIIHL